MQKVDVNLVEEGARDTQSYVTKESALAKLLVRFIMICLNLAHLERKLLTWLPSQAAGLKQHAVLKVPVHILTLVGELLLQSSLNYTSSAMAAKQLGTSKQGSEHKNLQCLWILTAVDLLNIKGYCC